MRRIKQSVAGFNPLGVYQMTVSSLIIGVLFGIIWGSLFAYRRKTLSNGDLPTNSCKSSAWFLARTSIIRYLLLAAFLALLITKYHLNLSWWTAGFLASFWILVFRGCNPWHHLGGLETPEDHVPCKTNSLVTPQNHVPCKTSKTEGSTF